MNWKFWQKKNDVKGGSGGLSKPRDLPEAVGRCLVVDLKMDPDVVWNYKAVTRRHEDNRDIKDIRIYNPARADAAGVAVRNFLSLDAFPELVLFEGWLNSKTHQMEIVDKTTEKAA